MPLQRMLIARRTEHRIEWRAGFGAQQPRLVADTVAGGLGSPGIRARTSCSGP